MEINSQAKLLLEYDGQCHLMIYYYIVIKYIQIEDALKGIKISLYTLKNIFELYSSS